jgi:hypothetical protein
MLWQDQGTWMCQQSKAVSLPHKRSEDSSSPNSVTRGTHVVMCHHWLPASILEGPIISPDCWLGIQMQPSHMTGVLSISWSMENNSWSCSMHVEDLKLHTRTPM